MKTPCSVIQDLLPLYAEELTGEDSRKLVEEHLEECENCKQTLEELKEARPQGFHETIPMQQVKKLLRQQLWLSVLLTACVVAVMAMVSIGWMLRDTPIPYSEEAIVIRENQDGSIDAVFDQPLGWATYGLQYDRETGLYFIELSCEGASPLYRWTSPEDYYVLPLVGPAKHCDYIIYENNAVDGEHILIWGELPSDYGHTYTLRRLTLNYYSLMAGAATLLMGLLWLLLRRRPVGKVFAYLSIFFLCYLAGHLLIVGNNTIIYAHVPRYFILICVNTVALFGAACSAIALYRLQKH